MGGPYCRDAHVRTWVRTRRNNACGMPVLPTASDRHVRDKDKSIDIGWCRLDTRIQASRPLQEKPQGSCRWSGHERLDYLLVDQEADESIVRYYPTTHPNGNGQVRYVSARLIRGLLSDVAFCHAGCKKTHPSRQKPARNIALHNGHYVNLPA